MIGDQLRTEVLEWIKNDPDKNTADQLNIWLTEGNEKELNRCFNGFLQFGTAGLRGPVGPGPSCICLLYTSPSPRDRTRSRMPSSA